MNKTYISIVLVMSAGLLLSGCISGGPTYGTDKSSTEQLMDDLGNLVSLQTQKGTDIDYKPRPDLVEPPSTDVLPEPQLSVTQNEQVWPESPEELRDRLMAEADANRDTPGYRSPLSTSGVLDSKKTAEQRRQEYIAAREIRQARYRDRRYLSDPPSKYREPVDTAPIGDVGDTEAKKERMAKANIRAKNGNKRWWEIWKRSGSQDSDSAQ